MNEESNKPKKAVALKYNQENENAPKLIARGAGKVANNIVSIGEEKEIPIVDDDQLLQLLYPLQPGEFIPESLYAPVAKLLAYVVYFKQQHSLKSNLGLKK